MPMRKKKAKKGLTLEQLRQRLREIDREAKQLNAKIERLKNEKIGTVRII